MDKQAYLNGRPTSLRVRIINSVRGWTFPFLTLTQPLQRLDEHLPHGCSLVCERKMGFNRWW